MFGEDSKRPPDFAQFAEIIEVIRARDNGRFQFRQEGRRDMEISGWKEEESFEATIAAEDGERMRFWWSKTAERPTGNYPANWPFIPNVDTTIWEAGKDDREMRVAVWTTGSQADVVDELMRQCVDSGWEHDSTSGAVIKFRSGNVSRLISGLPVGLLEHQVILFESS